MQETEKFEKTGCCREQNGAAPTADCSRDNRGMEQAEFTAAGRGGDFSDGQSGQAGDYAAGTECEREQACQAAEYEQKIAQLTTQLNTLQTQYALVMADMQNFRQRVEKERIQWAAHAQADVIKKLLPIIDNFDRGLQEAAKHGQNQDITGFSMIYKTLLKALTSLGVELMTDFTAFDPEKHEAIVQVDSPDHKPDDIVAVLENGYMFKGEVLRPAKVSVAK